MRSIPVTSDASERGVKNAQENTNCAHTAEVREGHMLVKNEHRRKHTSMTLMNLKSINECCNYVLVVK